MTKLCPYKKSTYYEAGHNTGAGYPDMWKMTELFCECIKERCMAWDTSLEYRDVTGEDGWCNLMR